MAKKIENHPQGPPTPEESLREMINGPGEVLAQKMEDIANAGRTGPLNWSNFQGVIQYAEEALKEYREATGKGGE